MTPAERQKRYRQAVKTRAATNGSPNQLSEIPLDDLAETFYRLYWIGRLNASRPLPEGVGDWADEAEREFWHAEVRRLATGRPLEILRGDDEVA